MPISFIDEFELDRSAFLDTGAFDVVLDVDSRLFIDPALLGLSSIAEFKDAKQKVESYFTDIITLLSHSTQPNDMFWRKADRLLTFTERTGTCFGYTQFGTNGKAIGKILRGRILSNVKEIVNAGEKDPSLFALLGVFQEGIGCDRISDLLTFILEPEILSFTHRVINEFNLTNIEVIHKKVKYQSRLNEYNEKPIMLLPSSLLSPLPIADSFDDIDWICSENQRVRDDINAYFDLGRRKKLSKAEICSLMKSNASFRAAILAAYKSFPTSPYDFDKDPIGEYIWYHAAKEYVEKYPLPLQLPQSASNEDMLVIVNKICERFRSLIEDNGLWYLLYNDNKEPKHERAAQLLFFGIADAYCTSNNIDLSREINNGRGFVDFKLSKGANKKVLVEVKLTSNGQLQHGFTTQIPIYMKQEKTQKAIYLIIDNGHPRALENFVQMYNGQPKEVKHKIPCYIIRGTQPQSASNA